MAIGSRSAGWPPLVCLLCAFATGGWAQDYPAKPIRMIVGGGPDIAARIFGQQFTEAWGQQAVIDNRPGASGSIAAEIVAKAPADGYTLLFAAPTFPINAAWRIGSYDHVRDFAPVVMCSTAPFIIVAHPSVPARTVRELIALASAKPGQINFASASGGGATQLAGDLFKSMAHIDIVSVAYKGAAAAMVDVIAGQVQIMFAVAAGALPQIRAGKVRALAVTTAQRSRLAPDLPTVAESGLPGYEVAGWNGILAPAGTSKAIILRLNAQVLRSLKQTNVVRRLIDTGYEPAEDNAPEQFGGFIKREIAKWTKLVRESGAKID